MKTVDFSETIVGCDPKVGRFRQLIEYEGTSILVFKVMVISCAWPNVIYI